jgi:hypothetical protein
MGVSRAARNAPTSGRRSREAATREVLDAAVGFLWKHPFRELSIGTLMNRTSIRRTSFYIYFKELFGMVEEGLWKEAAPRFESPTRHRGGITSVAQRRG